MKEVRISNCRMASKLFQFLFILCFLIPTSSFFSQDIPSDRVVDINELSQYLNEEVRLELKEDSQMISEAILAHHFRNQFEDRFFFSYKSVDRRFKIYNQKYNNQAGHEERAMDHMHKYADSTHWLLPFNYLNGEPVNAYALRHLARQHKMVDIALQYFYDGKDPKYIRYFVNQMKSLNDAFHQGKYDRIEDGNGVYEVFRSGYRILNWLNIHNLFINEEAYTDEDQLLTIATLLQHGAHLYERNASFRSGNHQTRGMSALAMLSIIFTDFKDADLWYERAMIRLGEHLDHEINDDGFQFERSVHYHMSDIGNFFYVYQLAKINNIEVDPEWENKLRSLFTTLIKIAYPDKSAPVLQDDTEIPWGEKNDISGAMTLGYILFEDPSIGYFAKGLVNDRMYWFIQDEQLHLLDNIDTKKPSYGSLHFPETGYYVMREGWSPDDKMMIITAGLDDKKPDHQHGDMLGIQAIAYGKVVLPNYQVRYSLKDFDLFKNSMVKNVALVDDELQGKEWTSNKGGSGFGKFRNLPNPSTITWTSNDHLDLFVGSHDGFENIGVKYTRQVINVSNDFWIIKDNFSSEDAHTYHQVWQGHYTSEMGPRLIRSTYDDATGCDVFQLRGVDKVNTDGARGKEWSIVSKSQKGDHDFITVIFPYKGYSNRIDEEQPSPSIKEWITNADDWKVQGVDPVSISKEKEGYLFGVSKVEFDGLSVSFSDVTDVYLNLDDNNLKLILLGDKTVSIISSKGFSGPIEDNSALSPGHELLISLDRK